MKEKQTTQENEAIIKAIEYQKEINAQIDDAIERQYHHHGDL